MMNYLTIPVCEALPTAAADFRHQLRIKRASPTAASTLHVCRYNGSAWEWVEIVGTDATQTLTNKTIGDALDHDGTTVGFFGTTPATQAAANADTSGATLGELETEVNELKQLLRDYGLLAT
jgi:hypothetical protein